MRRAIIYLKVNDRLLKFYVKEAETSLFIQAKEAIINKFIENGFITEDSMIAKRLSRQSSFSDFFLALSAVGVGVYYATEDGLII